MYVCKVTCNFIFQTEMLIRRKKVTDCSFKKCHELKLDSYLYLDRQTCLKKVFKHVLLNFNII